ncbi:MAG: LysE family translocator [Rhizobiales bacterium]|nr:LysE family translocator [Hyphomicrobiales bacterium]MBO6698382.1 LysE family translocator [Hyphomicrobiales bacterium]MBO6735364.1 LysE family translocator [Hyphomicrobiales bacterium]MBO6910828.1 LysE family translocator [Hyphomicrobiales bacterium]MBO6957263.1 LysE family translocator [Hyphomicrobiales bacterium]
MALEVWLLYATTVLAFMVTPGPSHLLMLSNAMSHGFHRSLATAAGDLTANALQMLAAGIGLAALLVASQGALTIVKWAGVAYLIWMGLRMWLRASATAQGKSPATSPRLKTLWLQGFLTSAANPKAVVFFAALYPQFIQADGSFWLQFLILSATYIVIDGLFLTSYGAGAGWLSKKVKQAGKAMLDRVGASFLIGAAILLGLKTLRQAN